MVFMRSLAMRNYRIYAPLAALLLTLVVVDVGAQAPTGQPLQAQQAQEAQRAVQQAAQQARQELQQTQQALAQAQQAAQQPQPAPVARVVPGLPTVELAPLLQRVGRSANKRFIVDGRVGAQIYLAGTDANDVDYPVLLSILRANGLAAVEIEGRTNIIPEAEVRFFPTPIVPTDDAAVAADEWVTRVVSVTNVDAGGLIPILRPLLPVSAHLAAMPPSNRIVILDRYANVKRITAIVRALDVPAGRN
jgi:type II secretory pathway component GspD/PulD (secretin)